MEFNELITILLDEKRYAKENFVPIIRDESARFLYNYVKENEYKNILEIGTAIGYSGSIILGAGAQQLTTIDINSEYLDIAKNTFSKLGFSAMVDIYHEDAWEAINRFKISGKKFDMVFLDGAKGQYVKYLDILADLITDNGAIFADNVLLHGMVECEDKIPHRKRTMVMNLRKYLEKVNREPYMTKLIRMEDGVAITKIKRR